MRSVLITLLVACSAAPRVMPAPAGSSGVTIATDQLVRASHARWLGDPATAAKIVANAGDIDGLAELGRAELALGHVAAAQHAFEKAVLRAEHGTRGAWQWPSGIPQRIVHLAFTPDGKWLVSADAEGRIDVYDFASMRVVRSFATSEFPRTFAISPNNRWVAIAKDSTMVWDLETGALVAELPYNGAIVFAPSNRLLAARSDGGFVEVDVKTKQELRAVTGPKLSLLVTSGDKIYGVSGADVKVYDAQHVEQGTISMAKPISALEVDNGLVAVTEDTLVIRDTEIKGRYFTIAVSGSLVVATTVYGGVHLYRDGKLASSLSMGRNNDAFAFHPLGTLLVAGGFEGAAMWNGETGKHLATFAKPAVGALSLAFDARGDKLAVGSGAGHAAVWTLATGAVSTMTVRPGTIVDGVAFGPDGGLAAVAADITAPGRTKSTLVMFDAHGERRWSQELDHVQYLGYRPGTHTLTSVNAVDKPDGNSTLAAVMWKPDGKVDRVLELDASRGFHWTPDGSAVLGTTNTELVTTPVDGTPTRIDLPHYQSASHPGGKLLAAGLDDGRVAIWDLAAKAPTRVVFDDNGSLADLAWTPDGKTLVTASHDTVSLWDPATGNRLAAFVGPAPIVSLAMHPDGTLLATGHDDGRVTLWSIATGAQIATLHSPGELAAFVTAPDGRIDGTLSDDVLAWITGDHVLPARGAFARARVPGLLASQLAARSRDTQPSHAHPVPPPPPPACYPDGERTHRWLRAASIDGNRVRICLDYSYSLRSRVTMRPPTMCFDLDLETGKRTPHAPTPKEALGVTETPRVTAELEGDVAHVCDDGHCRDIAVRAAETSRASAHVDRRAKYLAVAYGIAEAQRDAVLVYDVATGKRVSQFIAQGANLTYDFLDETLMTTSTPCAGPCSSSTLYDVKKGREVGGVGVNTSAVSPTKIAGDVWAFNDWESTEVVLQNVKTGRVTDTIKLPKRACTNEPDSEYVSCEGITLLTAGPYILVLPSVRPGDVMVIDQKGKLVAEHPLPICP